MKVEGWDIPRDPISMYRVKWSEFLATKTIRPINEWIAIAESLSEEYNGLPTRPWLIQHGFSALVRAIMQYPHLFKHIKFQKPRQLPIAMHVDEAKISAKQNHGVIPSRSKLKANGQSRLIDAIRRYPDMFRGLQIEVCDTSGKVIGTQKLGLDANEHSPNPLAHHVLHAHKLAHTNKGIIPCSTDLINQGFIGLDRAIRKHPSLFLGMLQEVRNRYHVELRTIGA